MSVWRTCVFGAMAAALAVPGIAFAQLPDNYKTPGAATKATMTQICAADYVSSVKPVAGWQRTEALSRYGLRPETFTGDLDHLIPVALGGSNDPDNLFPFHGQNDLTLDAKTRLGDTLRQMVCDGKLSLKDAQGAFKKDWTKAYRQYAQALNAPGGE